MIIAAIRYLCARFLPALCPPSASPLPALCPPSARPLPALCPPSARSLASFTARYYKYDIGGTPQYHINNISQKRYQSYII